MDKAILNEIKQEILEAVKAELTASATSNSASKRRGGPKGKRDSTLRKMSEELESYGAKVTWPEGSRLYEAPNNQQATVPPADNVPSHSEAETKAKEAKANYGFGERGGALTDPMWIGQSMSFRNLFSLDMRKATGGLPTQSEAKSYIKRAKNSRIDREKIRAELHAVYPECVCGLPAPAPTEEPKVEEHTDMIPASKVYAMLEALGVVAK